MVFEIRERDGKGHGEIAQVVRLAAAGASNKQIGAQLFLSPRTVGFRNAT
jgi:ATP/maltotriose-dependent transcriptional regulator MalT